MLFRSIRGDVAGEIAKLKAEPGGDILVHGSCSLVHSLMEYGLVDEYRLMVFPILLGSGKRLFPETSDATRFVLTECGTAGDGILLLTYRSQ